MRILFTIAQIGRKHQTTKIMTIQKILGENGQQEAICNNAACPAAIIADDGNAYVQGYIPAPETADTLTAPTGEAFVRIPLPVLKKIAAQVVDA